MIIQAFLVQDSEFHVEKCRFFVWNSLSVVMSFWLLQSLPHIHAEAARPGNSNHKGLIRQHSTQCYLQSTAAITTQDVKENTHASTTHTKTYKTQAYIYSCCLIINYPY